MAFYVVVGIAVTFYLHSWGALWLYLVLFLNYTIAHSLRDHYTLPFLTWIFNLGILFSSYAYQGYRFSWIHPSLDFMDNGHPLLTWETYFKITMLRNISYNLDYY